LVGITTDPYDIEHDVSILDEASLAQTFSERLDKRLVIHVGWRTEKQESYPDRALALLRVRGHRGRRSRSETRNELASMHVAPQEALRRSSA
jgi:hypothetical protein